MRRCGCPSEAVGGDSGWGAQGGNADVWSSPGLGPYHLGFEVSLLSPASPADAAIAAMA